jgi:potassium/hydrogen antiporter
MSDGQMILVAGALLCSGLLATLAAGRLRVPGLLLFLAIGMAIGTDGTGWLDFHNYELARTIGVIGLALILFEGGLSTKFSDLRPVLGTAVSLAVIGTLITAAIAGLVATWLFDLSLLEGLLLGSIVAATDGAAIFALLRGSALKRKVGLTLEGESGMNDPFAVLLVVGLIDAIQEPHYGAGDVAELLVRQVGIGAVAGVGLGFLAVHGLRRARLHTEAAYALGTLGVAALAYGAADSLHGSGFLAVYLAGLTLGSSPLPAKRAVLVFQQGLSGLAEVAMFLVLGLLVDPSALGGVALEGTVLALILVLLARPVASFLATQFSGFDVRERAVLSWAGLRGAVPMVLATFPVIAGVPHSIEFFNIVFFAVLLSTLLQGSSFEAFARRLGVTVEPGKELYRRPTERALQGIAEVASVRPRDRDDSDPGYPSQVGGVTVREQVLTRIDEPGALVLLEDGRYAVTGPIIAVGSPRGLTEIARRRLTSAPSEEDLSWWREVIGALAR